MASLEEIRRNLRHYRPDAPVRLNYEHMLDLISRAAVLLRHGVVPMDQQASGERVQWLLDAGEPDWNGEPDANQ